MTRYILRRIFQGIPTFFGVTAITFLLMLAAPGDPISLITFSPNSNPETAQTMRRQLGLDQPAIVQYIYLGQITLSACLPTALKNYTR